MFLYHDVASGLYRNELWVSKAQKYTLVRLRVPMDRIKCEFLSLTSSLRIRRVCKCSQVPNIWTQL